MTTTTTSADTQRAYRAVLGRLADAEQEAGYPQDLESLRRRAPLTSDERAAIIAHHSAEFSNELAISTEVLAAYFRADIGVLTLMAHLREATDNACWSVLALDLHHECETRAEAEQMASDEEEYRHAPRTTGERRVDELALTGALR